MVKSNFYGIHNCLITLPQEKRIVLTDPTLEQFIDALWLIKQHKFDIWYELSGNSTIYYKNDSLIIIGVMILDHNIYINLITQNISYF